MASTARREAEQMHLNDAPPTDVFLSREGSRKRIKVTSGGGKVFYFRFNSCFIDRQTGQAEIVTNSGADKTFRFAGLTGFEILIEKRRSHPR